MTFAQARQAVIKILRGFRVIYRHADTAGEKFERSLDRLISKRKKIVVSAELKPLAEKLLEYEARVKDLTAAMGMAIDAITRFEL